MMSIVLVEPANPGNIGAVARVMANFGFKDLLLVRPRCNHLSQEARNRAKWGNSVLESAKKKTWKSILTYDTVIGTTAKLGTDYNIPRSPLTPAQLAKKPLKKKIALVFGREDTGLTNEEIKGCDFVVTIPATKKYATLNVSHAVAILLYSLAQASHVEHITPASRQDKELVMTLLKQKLNKMAFSTKEKKQTQITVWKRLISKSFLTRREAFALMGFLKKIK